jgi:hypothetical protein
LKAHFTRDIRQMRLWAKVNGNKELDSLSEEYENLKEMHGMYVGKYM